MEDNKQSPMNGGNASHATTTSTGAKAGPTKNTTATSWYDRVNPFYKEDTRPEWERKRDEKFKQWERDKYVCHPLPSLIYVRSEEVLT